MTNDDTGTRTADRDELMTAQRPPGHPSSRVRFGVFATAFALDMMVHIVVGVCVWSAVSRTGDTTVGPIAAGVAAATAASFVHRTLLQRIFRTTAGKAVFGLQLRRSDGSYPSLKHLVKQWFIGILATVGAPMQLLG